MLNLTVAMVVLTVAYLLFCAAVPTKPCRRCSGWGSRPARRMWGRRPRRRHCHKCQGTGRRFRVPARLAYRLRGAVRRHAVLSVRAAARAEAGPEREGQEREQARS